MVFSVCVWENGKGTRFMIERYLTPRFRLYQIGLAILVVTFCLYLGLRDREHRLVG